MFISYKLWILLLYAPSGFSTVVYSYCWEAPRLFQSETALRLHYLQMLLTVLILIRLFYGPVSFAHAGMAAATAAAAAVTTAAAATTTTTTTTSTTPPPPPPPPPEYTMMFARNSNP